MSVRKSLIVGENMDLLGMLKEQLELDGDFLTDQAANISDALRKTKALHYDIVLVDDDVEKKSGRKICINMRDNGVKSPIIMLSSSDDESDVVSILDAGANDFLTKPFRIQELMARIRARIREMEQSEFSNSNMFFTLFIKLT